jgi:hypothetical protein
LTKVNPIRELFPAPAIGIAVTLFLRLRSVFIWGVTTFYYRLWYNHENDSFPSRSKVVDSFLDNRNTVCLCMIKLIQNNRKLVFLVVSRTEKVFTTDVSDRLFHEI